MKIYFLFLIWFLFTKNVGAQTPLWDIFTISNQPYSNVVLDTLKQDTLQVKVLGRIYKIPVDSIATLKSERDSQAGIGVVFGVLSGAIIGFNLGGKSASNGTPADGLGEIIGSMFGLFMGSLLGGIVGGGVGSKIGGDKFYNFRKRSYSKKLEILQQAIKESKVRQPYKKKRRSRF
jgi:hypothetical protein